VEVMAAVTILSIGLIGSLNLINYNLRNISFQKNKIVAAGLVEDGMERVRNVRDTNWLKGELDWKHNIEGDIPPNKTITFFCANTAISGKVMPPPLNIDDCGSKCQIYVYTKIADGSKCYSDNFGNQAGYGYVTTDFYRLVALNEKSNDSVEVKVAVKWSEGGQDKYLTATEILYNWRQ
ncbi:MAG: hypothetical protein Q8N37_04940, partial [bacterium]|nr:hypothetical protein [bacterium]